MFKSVLIKTMFVLSLLCVPFMQQVNAAESPKTSDLVIGMSFQEMNNPYFIVMYDALKDICQSLGAKLIVTDGRHDINKQINDVEDMIQQGVDILLLNPTDQIGMQGAVETAKKAGTIVVCVDAKSMGPIDTYVASDNVDAGYIATKYMCEQLKGKGKVALLDGIPVDGILDRVEGFKKACSEYPGIEIVDVQNGKQERSVALSVVENMIQAHPDLDGIFSVNDGGSYGALAAIEASGKDIILVSVDGAPEACKNIAEGSPFKATAAQFPKDQIRIGVGLAMAKLWGANVVPEELRIGVKLIDKSKAETFSW